MECLNIGKILSLLAVLFCSFIGSAQYLVNDPKTTAQVAINMGMQLTVENEHNLLLDSINAKKEEIAARTTAIYASKELYLQTLENTDGFGAESEFYKDIAATSTKIAELSTKVLSAIKQSNMANKANAVIAVSDLSLKATRCVNDFINIVTNCKVEHPLKKTSSNEDIIMKSDGYNLLDRYERMNLAIQISYDLKCIKNKLDQLLFLCSYGDWSSLIYQIDHKTWATLFNGKDISEKIINQWNKQIK